MCTDLLGFAFHQIEIFLLPTTLRSALRSTEPYDRKKNNNQSKAENIWSSRFTRPRKCEKHSMNPVAVQLTRYVAITQQDAAATSKS
jgi:hypothetical protein